MSHLKRADRTEAYPHQACEQEMKRIDQEWRKYIDQHTHVRAVVQTKPEGNLYLNILDIQYTPEGAVVYVV